MTDPREAEIPPWPHKPAPPEPKRLLPERAMLARGLGMLGASGALLLGGITLGRWNWVAGLLAAPVVAVAGGLFAWAAAIHLTGGEKFDDHPWV